MKSLIFTTLLLLTITVGANSQENQKEFTAEEQVIIDLSNAKWDWMVEKKADSNSLHLLLLEH